MLRLTRSRRNATHRKKRGGLMSSKSIDEKLADAMSEIETLNQLIASKDRTIAKLNETITILEDTLKKSYR